MRSVHGTVLSTTVAILLTLSLLPSGGLAAGPATAPSTMTVVGNPAPDFSLKDIKGNELKLSDLTQKGPVVLIQLRGWVGYQCPICTRQFGDFITHRDALDAAGAQVVFVYPGPALGLEDHAKDFISGKGLPASFHFLLDPDLVFVNAYGLRWDKKGETAYPSTFVIDRKGIFQFVKISHSHGDRATTAEVLNVLKGLK